MNYVYVDPIVTVEVNTASIPTIHQPLTLQCNGTTVRGITSTVDIIWTTGDTQVRRVNNVTASSSINSTSVYNNLFITPSLNVTDIGSVYQCEVLINSILPTTAKSDFVIPIPGKYVCVFLCIASLYLLTHVHVHQKYYFIFDYYSYLHICMYRE